MSRPCDGLHTASVRYGKVHLDYAACCALQYRKGLHHHRHPLCVEVAHESGDKGVAAVEQDAFWNVVKPGAFQTWEMQGPSTV